MTVRSQHDENVLDVITGMYAPGGPLCRKVKTMSELDALINEYTYRFKKLVRESPGDDILKSRTTELLTFFVSELMSRELMVPTGMVQGLLDSAAGMVGEIPGFAFLDEEV